MLRTFLDHPRRLWVRRAIFQVHLWVGVLLAMYVVVIALTGSLLVFRSELGRASLPTGMRRYDARRTAPVEVVLERFRAAYPGATVEELTMPSEAMPVFALAAKEAGGREFAVVADSVTAALYARPRGWMEWVYDLHVYLLLGKAYGMQVNGVGAAGLLLLSGTGLFLWWPGVRIWARGLRISLRHSWRRINYDAHSAIGFWTLFLVSWWGVSGVYFGWYRPVMAGVAAVSPLVGMRAPVVPTVSGAGRVTLGQVLAAVHAASPAGRLFSVSDPMMRGPVVYAAMDLRAAGDFSHRDLVTVSTADARVLTVWHYGRNVTAGDWFLWAMHPLHFGTLWGTAWKVVWAGCGVLLALLTGTGLVMYWNRYLRHRVRSLAGLRERVRRGNR